MNDLAASSEASNNRLFNGRKRRGMDPNTKIYPGLTPLTLLSRLNWMATANALKFATTNPGKLREAVAWLGRPVEGVHLEMDELQTTDLERLVRFKAEQAHREVGGDVLVEDTILVFDAWGKLPGPFIKFFLADLGGEGLAAALEPFGDNNARAICGMGFHQGGRHHFFSGEVAGRIVHPRGGLGFGFDPIFQPHGASKTLGEMEPDEKRLYSMRAQALGKLALFLAEREAD